MADPTGSGSNGGTTTVVSNPPNPPTINTVPNTTTDTKTIDYQSAASNTRVSDTGISVQLPGGALQFSSQAQLTAWQENPQSFAVQNVGGVNTVVPFTSNVGTENTNVNPSADPQVPQPVDQFAALRQAQIDRNGGVDPNAVSPDVQAQLDRINAREPGPATFSLPTQADYAALRQAQIDRNGGVDPNAVSPEVQAQLDRINAREPGPPLGTLSEQLAAAGLSAPPSQLDQGTIDALNRIEANKAQPGSDGSLPTQADFAALRAAQINQNGGVDPNATPPDVQAQLDRINASRAGEVPPQSVNPVAYDDDGNLLPGFELNEDGDPVRVGATPTVTTFTPKAVPPTQAGPVGTPYDDDGNLMPGWTLDENNNPVYVGGGFVEPATQASANASREQAAQEAAIREKAKQQATFQARYKQTANQDWRVRLSLSPNAQYLYNAGTPRGSAAGILAPLTNTDGVIFPYTPSITTTYSANYEQYDLVHSNYRGVFYKNSRVGDINIRGTFTAQDTNEANYLLAVIHFFRSATKMFYGQDAERGTPPPVCLLNGLGTYQFSDHPVVISSFNYTTPNDVDYIRAVSPNNYGSNLLNRRAAVASNPGGSSLAGLNRLLNAVQNGLSKGALPNVPAPSPVNQTVNNTAGATYVPTKMEVDITLIPVQTRSQVSKQFSLKGFANGQLLKGGFW